MKILKFIWDVIQCFIVGVTFVGILILIGTICLLGFLYVLNNISQIAVQIIVYIILLLVLGFIIFSLFGIGNEILRKF